MTRLSNKRCSSHDTGVATATSSSDRESRFRLQPFGPSRARTAALATDGRCLTTRSVIAAASGGRDCLIAVGLVHRAAGVLPASLGAASGRRGRGVAAAVPRPLARLLRRRRLPIAHVEQTTTKPEPGFVIRGQTVTSLAVSGSSKTKCRRFQPPARSRPWGVAGVVKTQLSKSSLGVFLSPGSLLVETGSKGLFFFLVLFTPSTPTSSFSLSCCLLFCLVGSFFYFILLPSFSSFFFFLPFVPFFSVVFFLFFLFFFIFFTPFFFLSFHLFSPISLFLTFPSFKLIPPFSLFSSSILFFPLLFLLFPPLFLLFPPYPLIFSPSPSSPLFSPFPSFSSRIPSHPLSCPLFPPLFPPSFRRHTKTSIKMEMERRQDSAGHREQRRSKSSCYSNAQEGDPGKSAGLHVYV
ncbi:hypothetical protein C7M84_023235 [Penaeus vannamei]|uniref:Uncharacterized protein n=1 Tax=Penaeus vannamei TaxID=6689 RepID=A0A3R7MQX9_PENVA|nr:hypothetical protein C7M84_023235 [Penaeus vannamei]